MPASGVEPQAGAARAVVVSDAGPLIALGRLDLLHLLTDLFSAVHVPQQVMLECLARPANPDAQRIRTMLDSGQFKVCVADPMDLPGLEPGECAAIGHALAISAGVLLDDGAARQRAAALGLHVMGTLGVLVRARQRGLVGPLAPLVAGLRSSGQRLGREAVAQALLAVGEEAPP